jgi:carbapenam-3-carboxylate synthase
VSGFVVGLDLDEDALISASSLLDIPCAPVVRKDRWIAVTGVPTRRGLSGLLATDNDTLVVGYGDRLTDDDLELQSPWRSRGLLRSGGVLCGPREALIWTDETAGCPVYVGFGANTSPVFSSEAKVVAALIGSAPRLIVPSTGRPLPDPYHTLFPGVFTVPAGSVLSIVPTTFGWCGLPERRYFSTTIDPTVVDREVGLRCVETALRSSIARCIEDSDTVGVSLSGGVDSSLVAKFACEHPCRVVTYTVGTPYGDEFEAAKASANIIGSEHRELLMTVADLQSLLPDLIWSMETVDLLTLQIAAPAAFLYRSANAYPGTFLTGYGADLLFAGVLDPDSPELEIESRTLKQVTDTVLTNEFSPAFASRCGITVRYPYWTREMLLAALSLRGRLKTHDRVPKHILRLAASSHLPLAIAWRRKIGIHEGSAMARLFADAFGCALAHTQAAVSQFGADVFAERFSSHGLRPTRNTEIPLCVSC